MPYYMEAGKKVKMKYGKSKLTASQMSTQKNSLRDKNMKRMDKTTSHNPGYM